MKHVILVVATVAVVFHVLFGHGSIALADSITTSTTQDGGTFTNSSGTLLIGSTNPSLPAVLTLKNGAVTSGIVDVGVGATSTSPFGAIEVLSGSVLTNSRDAYAAGYSGSPSNITISNPGSKWSIGRDLYFGSVFSPANMTINDGGQLSTRNTYINSNSPYVTNITVSGENSKWSNSGDVEVGGNTLDPYDIYAIEVFDSGTIEIGGLLNLTNNPRVYLDGGTIKTHSLKGNLNSFYDGELIVQDGVIQSYSTVISGRSQADLPRLKAFGVQAESYLRELEVGTDSSGAVELGEGSIIYSTNVTLGSQQTGLGTATIAGTNTDWEIGGLHVGYFGTGEINITDAAKVYGRSTYLGYAAGSEGKVTVSGTGSTFKSNADLWVGYAGIGTLEVLDGANGESSDIVLGLASGSSGSMTVSGDGSRWTNTLGTSTRIGNSGIGLLNIVDGGEFLSSFVQIGSFAGAVGRVTVLDNGSKWESYGISPGIQGEGSVEVRNGGEVVNRYIGYVGLAKTSLGTITVSGKNSKWTNNDSLFVGGNETDTGGTGIVVVEDGGVLHIGELAELVLWTGGTLTGNGGTIIGNVDSYGLVSPGSSPGIMTIDGNYTQQSTGEIHIELAGLGQGTEYDYLHITGLTVLDGLLTIDLLDGFEDLITPTDTFTILSSDGGLTGDFSNLDINHRLNSRWGSFLVSYENNSVVLSDFVAVPEAGSLTFAALGIVGFAVTVSGRMTRSHS